MIGLVPIDGEPTGDGAVSGAVACDDTLGGAPRPDDEGVPTLDDPMLPAFGEPMVPTPDVPGAPIPEPIPEPTPDPTPDPALPAPDAVVRPEPTVNGPAGVLGIPACGDVMLGGVPTVGDELRALFPGTAGVGAPGTTIELGVVELNRAD